MCVRNVKRSACVLYSFVEVIQFNVILILNSISFFWTTLPTLYTRYTVCFSPNPFTLKKTHFSSGVGKLDVELTLFQVMSVIYVLIIYL